jgi:hypothetical protein
MGIVTTSPATARSPDGVSASAAAAADSLQKSRLSMAAPLDQWLSRETVRAPGQRGSIHKEYRVAHRRTSAPESATRWILVLRQSTMQHLQLTLQANDLVLESLTAQPFTLELLDGLAQ